MSDKIAMNVDQMIDDSRPLAEKVAALYTDNEVEIGHGIVAAMQVAVVGSNHLHVSVEDFMMMVARVYERFTGTAIQTIAIPISGPAVPMIGGTGGDLN